MELAFGVIMVLFGLCTMLVDSIRDSVLKYEQELIDEEVDKRAWKMVNKSLESSIQQDVLFPTINGVTVFRKSITDSDPEMKRIIEYYSHRAQINLEGKLLGDVWRAAVS